MTYPAFFDQSPSIVVHDRLAQFLGAFSDGLITYRYLDAVRLAGHSCPTVAGAYLMTRRALQLLYPDAIAERGAVQVQFSAAQDEGVTGVIAGVIGLITGAAGAGGFKGIGGDFRRQNLMHFGFDADAEVRFERSDSGACVRLGMQMNRVPAEPGVAAALQKIRSGQAAPEELAHFAALWQERVRRILTDHADDPELIVSAE